MLRKVIDTETYRPERTIPSARSIIDTLECGHQIRNKGSAGHAKRRQCHDCESLKNGSTTRSIAGNRITTWDSETNMPVRLEMTKLGVQRRQRMEIGPITLSRIQRRKGGWINRSREDRRA